MPEPVPKLEPAGPCLPSNGVVGGGRGHRWKTWKNRKKNFTTPSISGKIPSTEENRPTQQNIRRGRSFL